MNVITLPVPHPFCSYIFSAYAANCPDNNNAMQRANFFLNADLLQWRLAEHASSTFRWSKNNGFFQVLWSSTV